MTTVFISDLHLSPHKPELSVLFQAFLREHSGSDVTIYVLGDLFDIWLGDDFSAQFYASDIEAIKHCTQQGTRIHLMHGNRDFLVGQAFCDMTGMALMTDPTLIQLLGQPTLLCHGDQLCTDDHSYQQFRTMIQNEAWKTEFLAKSPQERLQIAEHFRQESAKLSKDKSAEIMDVNQQAVEAFMQEHHCHVLIHGHTHRPQCHDIEFDGKPAQRWVLGDWHPEHAQYLRLNADGLSLGTFRSQ